MSNKPRLSEGDYLRAGANMARERSREPGDFWNQLADLLARLAATPAEAGPSDDVLEALALRPDQFRSEGGAINGPKLRAAILHPEEYLPPEHWLRSTASPPSPSASPASAGEAVQPIITIVREAIRVADDVGRSRGMNCYAHNTNAVTKLVDLEMETERRLSEQAAKVLELREALEGMLEFTAEQNANQDCLETDDRRVTSAFVVLSKLRS